MTLKITEHAVNRYTHVVTQRLSWRYKSLAQRKHRMQRLTSILFLAITLIAPLPHASGTQEQWQRITDREAGFTISFPGKPDYKQLTNPTTDEPMENYSLAYGAHHLQIIFWTLTDPPRSKAESIKWLNNAVQVYGRNAGTLLRQKKLPDGGRQYDNVLKDQEGTLHLRTRLYLCRGTLYQLTYGTYAPNGINERIAGRFFSSFKLKTSKSGLSDSTRAGSIRKRTQQVAK